MQNDTQMKCKGSIGCLMNLPPEECSEKGVKVHTQHYKVTKERKQITCPD